MEVIGSQKNATPELYAAEYYQQIIPLINAIFLCAFVSFFGIIANIINLIVYYRQGLKSTINLSLFALAVADLMCLLVQEWMVTVYFMSCLGVAVDYSDFFHLTGGLPHETLTRLTTSITVYITAERCICVVFPLKMKQIITIKRTAFILIFIYVVTFSSWIPLYSTSSLVWKFIPELNRTILTSVTKAGKEEMDKVLYFINAIFGVASVSTVICFTSVLICMLRAKSVWRRSVSIQHNTDNAMSNRERTTSTMVVLIAVILVVCYMPSVILCVVTFIEPEFNFGRRYVVIFDVFWSFAILFEDISSSINILLYIKMSSKYRNTLKTLFNKRFKNAF
ncbi:unnamed protein product [Candidula unifasciata]|uniref:G-protein coupled receptors family 1 profile domain-containing protein n=1 Tax=Candidula unifasciata TaxID=100452 RepID=A0A8S3YZ91_9EUPU|nr:unnamed protein product [Candidula unifasciata]